MTQHIDIIAENRSNHHEDPPDAKDNPGNGPKYFVPVEGTEYPWDSSTITTEQISALSGLNINDGIIMVDENQDEHTLRPGEVITLQPGHRFGKKLGFKRG